MSEVFGVTPWVDGAVSTGPLSELEQDRLDVAARKGSLVTALDNPIVGGVSNIIGISSASLATTTGIIGNVYVLTDGESAGAKLAWAVPAGETEETWCWWLWPQAAYA